MEFLAKNLWHIFEVCDEERTDGDSFSPDLVNGAVLFLSALNGAKDTDYKCLQKLDKKALLAEWAQVDQQVAHREYAALIASVPGHRDADKCAELCKAFQAKDRNLFEKHVAEGLAALYKPEE